MQKGGTSITPLQNFKLQSSLINLLDDDNQQPYFPNVLILFQKKNQNTPIDTGQLLNLFTLDMHTNNLII